MDRGSMQNQISGGGLLAKWTRDLRLGTKALRQRVGHVGQRISRAACDDELALAEQRLSVVPLGNIGEGIDTDQKQEAVAFLERRLKPLNRINRVIRFWRPLSAARAGSLLVRRLQQRRNKSPFLSGGQCHHGVTLSEWGKCLLWLVRRNARRHEINSIQVASLKGGACQCHVPAMNGIERPTEEADLHARLVS